MKLKHSVAANFIAQGWVIVCSLLFVPIYIKYLGIEVYGLIGFFIAVQAWVVILDLGLAMTLNRAMAIYSEVPTDSGSVRALLRSAEKVYAFAGVAIALLVFAVAPHLAAHWFQASTLTAEQTTDAIGLLGLALVLRWTSQIYRSAIQGLRRQVWLAWFTAGITTLRSVGAWVILMSLDGSVVSFFAWNAAIGAIELVWLVVRLYRYVPAPQRGSAIDESQPARSPLLGVWRFAGAVFMTNLFAVVMTQSDKIILPKLISLVDFGYYTFAFTIGTAAAGFATPIFQAVAPRLSADIASGDTRRIVATYHKACQTMALVILPAAAIGIVHSRSLIEVWAGDSRLAEHSALLASVFIAAYMINSLIQVPAALALAHGWANWGMWTNAVCALLIIPSVLFATRHFGVVGAAGVNLLLNLIYYFVAVKVLHAKVLPTEWRSWFLRDTFVPVALCMAGSTLLLYVAPHDAGRWQQGAFLVGGWAVVSVALGLALPYPRSMLLHALPKVAGRSAHVD